MRLFFIKIFLSMGRWLFSLRYKVDVKGLELIDSKNLPNPGGILLLPNHPAHIDPILIVLYLWPKKQFRPLAIEYMYRQPFINTFMKLIKALPIPNFETSVNDIKLKKAEQVLQIMSRGLKRGQNFLLYPAGRLKHTGKELIGGASATQQLLKECPDCNVVLIRTVGLWGSRFSRAYTGKSPDFKKKMVEGILACIKNFIFFMPRRRVTLEFYPEPKDFPKTGSRIEVNRYLEKFYNQYPSEIGTTVTEEPINLVSSYFYKKEYPGVEYTKKRNKVLESLEITPKVEQDVFTHLSKLSGHKISEIKKDMSLSLDLGLDSLDIAQLVVHISEHYDVGEVYPEDLNTVQDALEVASGREKSTREYEEEDSDIVWPKEKRPLSTIPQGKTIPEAFFNVTDRMHNLAACGDDLLGILTYKRLKLAALVLSTQIAKLPGQKVGVLLPASAGAYIVILACLIAKKVPVMLNWTLGPKYLNHMMEEAEIKAVISSWKFLERLSYVELGDLAKKVHLLENIKKKIKLSQKLKGAFLSKLSSEKLMKMLKLNTINENDPAVILFTSGTESVPKGVPLSHKNILDNQRSAMQSVDINKDDVLFGILPPFHSFGFSVAGLLPILMGVKVAYYPDPTDSHALAKGIDRWKITIFCSAPSFLKGLLQVATKRELRTVRLFVTGAEKAPQELFDKVRNLGKNKEILEGYGITECSPIISINRPNQKAKGVGKPIGGVEIVTIHPETEELLSEHAEGELCVYGPNVFNGYLDKDKNPFIELNGKKYYRTGDLGKVDEEGYLILSGRKKRFTKIGGEMISFGALEHTIYQGLLNKGIKPEDSQVAVLASEREQEKTFLVLFTTQDIDAKEANAMLRDDGFSRIVKISQVHKLDEIPVMGTGKVDFRRLQSLVQTLENE